MQDRFVYASFKGLVKRINYAIAMLGGTAVFLTIFTTSMDIVGRLIGIPLAVATEASQLALAALLCLGWAYTQEEKGHIAIDLVFGLLPAKVKRLIAMFNPLIGIGLTGLLTYQGFVYAMQSRSSNEIIESVLLPIWPFKLLISIGAFMFCLQQIIDMIDTWLERGEK